MLQTRPAKDQKKRKLVYFKVFANIRVYTLHAYSVIFFSVRLFTEV